MSIHTLEHDYEQLPILGHIIWYGLTGIKTDRTTLLHLLTKYGFQGYAPEPPTDKLALQRALREWIRLRGTTQRNAGDEDDETATRALIRPINKRRAKYAVYAIVEGIPNTIRTRKGGTVYFVPNSEKVTLLAFQQLIESLPVDPGSASTPHLIMVPIVDEAHARQELARAVHIGFVADLEALDKDLDDLRSKVKHVSPDAIARRLEKFKTVRDRARTYATLLSLQQETIAEKIDALHQKATAMLTELLYAYHENLSAGLPELPPLPEPTISPASSRNGEGTHRWLSNKVEAKEVSYEASLFPVWGFIQRVYGFPSS